MKRTPLGLVVRLVVLGVVLGAGYWIADVAYFKPVGELRRQLGEMDATFKRATDTMEDWPSIKRELQGFGLTQIGREFDQVEHRLRTSLQDIGERAGLRAVQVSNGPPRAQRTPLDAARLRGKLGRELMEAHDFAVVKGTFSGSGSLEQVVRAVAFLQVQPWLHRIERVSIEPRGRERQTFGLDVAFSVAVAPDLCPADAAMPPIVAPGEELVKKAARIAERNVFVAPPVQTPKPLVVETPVDPIVPPPAVPPAYDRWKVTGLVERRVDGQTLSVEAWVTQTATGERRILRPGEEVLGHVFEWAEGERGYFVFEGRRFVIRQGQTLADRVPADQVDSPASGGGSAPMPGAMAGEGEG
ncbi:MAG: hypothetical protein DYG94_05435 [Leptolyngbya sp. PLA3]|nr:MAG: hypothetical protein EDM82_04685 [Cyanobacteria bacterium CYA]MCE7968176.1 hypothetical protein [Leptolyngbya sp. PL-A3]